MSTHLPLSRKARPLSNWKVLLRNLMLLSSSQHHAQILPSVEIRDSCSDAENTSPFSIGKSRKLKSESWSSRPHAAVGGRLDGNNLMFCQRQSAEASSVPRERVECVVVGAGVVGLAIARELALLGREVWVIEGATDIGTRTSSRNSEVVHAGIYYLQGKTV